jgi:hypothetical protein
MIEKPCRLFWGNALVAGAKRSPLLDVPTRSINGEVFGKSQKRSF